MGKKPAPAETPLEAPLPTPERAPASAAPRPDAGGHYTYNELGELVPYAVPDQE